jgi:CubicO group peptidase (beta-lactamase class C family)
LEQPGASGLLHHQDGQPVALAYTLQFSSDAIDAIFADLDQRLLPGAAVGIAVRGKPVYERAFGLANMDLPVPFATDMRIRIASISKHFTCLAFLLLCEEQRVGIDDPVGRFLPNLHPSARDVTFRQLMTHTSGLRDAHDLCYQLSGTGQAATVAGLLSLYEDLSSQNAPPGETWLYNNGGYLLLSVAIELISGQSLEQFLSERIFAPAGLGDTVLKRWDTDFLFNSAAMHMSTKAGGFDRSYIGKEHVGEGGIVSTADDLLRWLVDMDHPKVGSPESWALMTAPQRLNSGAPTGYGLGLRRGSYRGVATINHTGGLMGCNGQMMKLPELGLDIVVLVNRHDVSAVERAQKIIDASVTGLAEPVAPVHADASIGVFASPSTGRVVELFERDGRQVAAIDGFDIDMAHESDALLWPAAPAARGFRTIALNGDPRRPDCINLNEYGAIDRLERLPPATADGAASIDGLYRSTETGTVVTISDGGSTFGSRGRFGTTGYRLARIAPSIWRAVSDGPMPWGGVLRFDGDASSLGFMFSSERTVNLPFERVG